MHLFWFEYLILFFVFFYGSKRDVESTRIKFLGFTLYERRRDSALPPPKTTFALTGGGGEKTDEDESEDDEDAEEEETDERDLWERLADAGFAVIHEKRDLRLTDVGAIKASESHLTCACCEERTHFLSEVFERPSEEGGRVGVALQSWLGRVCEQCGHVVLDASLSLRGKLAPLLKVNVNFFDVLDYFERVRGGDAEGATEKAGLPLLESRRDQLEAELNEVRTAIMREKHERGEGQAYREADRTLDAPKDETPSIGTPTL